jgi:DNA-binding NarL/FixJ family response regulator
MRIKVVLVDGRKMLREGQSVLLEKHSDLKVVGEADDPATAPKLVKALAADVVVLNTGSNTRQTTEWIKTLCTGRAGVRIIVLCTSASATFVREVISAGASGCLTKECASEELASAIRAMNAGRTYLSPRMSEASLAAPSPLKSPAPWEPTT